MDRLNLVTWKRVWRAGWSRPGWELSIWRRVGRSLTVSLMRNYMSHIFMGWRCEGWGLSTDGPHIFGRPNFNRFFPRKTSIDRQCTTMLAHLFSKAYAFYIRTRIQTAKAINIIRSPATVAWTFRHRSGYLIILCMKRWSIAIKSSLLNWGMNQCFLSVGPYQAVASVGRLKGNGVVL